MRRGRGLLIRGEMEGEEGEGRGFNNGDGGREERGDKNGAGGSSPASQSQGE